MVVTIAVKSPAMGLADMVTVNVVAVAAVTAPTAPLLNVTVLLANVVSKPVPVIVTVAALADTVVVAAVMAGTTVAIWIAAPLLMELLVTTAVKLPALGPVLNVTVSELAVAALTEPTAPLLRVTELFAATGSNAIPLITTVVAVGERAVALTVTAGRTRATWTAEPLVRVFDVTTAVKLPEAVGGLVSLTVSVVAVAAVTVPAPLLKLTVLLAAVVSKPKPVIVIVRARGERSATALVTTGFTLAT